MLGRIVKVIVALIENEEGKILLLHRAPDAKWAPSRWNVVSGKIEEGEEPLAAAFREVKEETKMKVDLKNSFPMYDVPYEGTIWRTWAFTFRAHDSAPTLDREHTAFEWVPIEKLPSFDLVPILEIDLREIGYLRGVAQGGER